MPMAERAATEEQAAAPAPVGRVAAADPAPTVPTEETRDSPDRTEQQGPAERVARAATVRAARSTAPARSTWRVTRSVTTSPRAAIPARAAWAVAAPARRCS